MNGTPHQPHTNASISPNLSRPGPAQPSSAHLAWLCSLIVVWRMIDHRSYGGKNTSVEKEFLDALDAQLITGHQRHLLLPEVRNVSLGLLICLSQRVDRTRVR